MSNVEILDASSNVIWSNSSNCDGAYAYYNSLGAAPILVQGESYTLRVTIINNYNWRQQHLAMWLDLNGDGDFYGSDEYIGGTAGSPTENWNMLATNYDYDGTFSRSFTMPSSGVLNTYTRMRISNSYEYDYDFIGDPCYDTESAETEDYDVITLGTRNNYDLAAVAVNPAPSFCGDAGDKVLVTVANLSGMGKVAGFDINVDVNGTLNGNPISTTFTETITDSIDMDQLYTAYITGLNTLGGADISLTAYITWPDDEDNSNDQARDVYWYILGTPDDAVPPQTSVTRCGSGSFDLSSNYVTDQTSLWWDESSDGNVVYVGDDFTTPNLVSSKTYYVEKAKFGNSVWLGAGFDYYGYDDQQPGYFFNIRTNASGILLDGINWYAGSNNPTDLYLFYKADGYGGSESDESAWTLATKITGYVPENYPDPSFLPTSVVIPPGATYGFYLFSSDGNAAPWYTYNRYDGYDDGTISVQGDACSYGSGAMFSPNVNTGPSMDFQLLYRRACLSSSRVAVDANVKRIPTGSSLAKGAVFNGTYRSGSVTNFDHVKAGDQNQYNIVAPTGFNNADHNVTWKVMSLSVTKPSGAAVASSLYSYAVPSSSGPGKFTFKPNATLTDSLIQVNITMRNLNPSNLCDSTITRYIYVAPVPKTSFGVLNACNGDKVSFNNQTTLSTGTAGARASDM